MIEKALGSIIRDVLANPVVAAAGWVLLGTLVVGWLVATLWAFQDAASRSRNPLVRYLAATWILLSGPILLPLSIPVWNLVRPAARQGDRELAVVEELYDLRTERPTCFACASRIAPGWVRCPTCSTWLAARCDRCERWAPRDASICPWCAWEPGASVAELPEVRRVEAPAGRPLSLGGLRPVSRLVSTC
jgi:hypothetical protein